VQQNDHGDGMTTIDNERTGVIWNNKNKITSDEKLLIILEKIKNEEAEKCGLLPYCTVVETIKFNYSINSYKNIYNKLPHVKSYSEGMFNILPIKTIIDSEHKYLERYTSSYINHNYSSDNTKKINSICTIGKEDIVLAYMGIDGKIFILQDVFLRLIKIDEQQARDAISNIFNYCKKVLNAYDLIDNDELKDLELLREDIMLKMLGYICDKLDDSNISNINIPRLVNDSIRLVFKSRTSIGSQSIILQNSNEMYRNSLTAMIKQTKFDKEKSFKNGISIGTQLTSALSSLGYEQEHNNWIKNVNINPEICVHNSLNYKIQEKYRIFKITKLKLDPHKLVNGSFLMYAFGSHPNVNAGDDVICIGVELSIKYQKLLENSNTTISNYINFIKEVEKVLNVINYDSAYIDINSLDDDDGPWQTKMDLVDVEAKDIKVSKKFRRI